MKAVKICVVILLAAMVINWVRSGESYHISRVLPGLGGDPLGFYDIAGVAILGIIGWGIYRLMHNARRKQRRERELDDNLQRYMNYRDHRFRRF